jgi:hypothetical protein
VATVDLGSSNSIPESISSTGVILSESLIETEEVSDELDDFLSNWIGFVVVIEVVMDEVVVMAEGVISTTSTSSTASIAFFLAKADAFLLLYIVTA